VQEILSGLHVLCWEVVRRESRDRGLTFAYVVGEDRSWLLGSIDAWRSVTCPTCQDTWRIEGPGVSGVEVVAVRQAMLAAVCLGL